VAERVSSVPACNRYREQWALPESPQLSEEKATDEAVTQLAEATVNQAAEAA